MLQYISSNVQFSTKSYERYKERVKWDPYTGNKQATGSARERAQVSDLTEEHFKVILVENVKKLRI